MRGVLFRHQFLGARLVQPRQFEGRACVRQVAFGLCHVRLKNDGIDLRDHLARFHLRIKIDEQFLNVARDLAADLHVDHGIQRPGCGDRLGDGSLRYRRCLECDLRNPGAVANQKRDPIRNRAATISGMVVLTWELCANMMAGPNAITTAPNRELRLAL